MHSIAVNIADLTRLTPLIAQILLGPVTPGQNVVRGVELGKVDDGAVILECESTRALAIVEILRRKDASEKRYLTRAYQQGPRGEWKKI